MNTKMLLPLALTTALAATLSMSACAQKTDADTSAPTEMSDNTAAPQRADSMSVDRMPADTMVDAVTAGDIVDTASQSPDHSTLVAAVKAADLVGTLQGAGPFTVFAPTNAAFDKLPEGTVDTLLKPDNKADLAGILTYHVVSGSVDAATLTDQIKDAGGKAELTTVNGATLTAEVANGGVKLTDDKGNSAMVTTADLMASNGVIHVIDAVLLP